MPKPKPKKTRTRKPAAKNKPAAKKAAASTQPELTTNAAPDPKVNEEANAAPEQEATPQTAPETKMDPDQDQEVEAAAAFSDEQVELIAETCHERNRGYCLSIGDDSQLPWDQAPDWQRQSAISGVVKAINGDLSPEDSHISWMDQKLADGWNYGKVKDPEAKTHPCMVPYAELPDAEKRKDEIFLETVKVMSEGMAAELDELDLAESLDWFAHEDLGKNTPTYETEPVEDEPADEPMLLKIDVVSYAAAVGHQAASRICDLIEGAPQIEAPWYDLCPDGKSYESVEKDVLAMVSYVASRPRPMNPETLFRRAAELKLHSFPQDTFPELPLSMSAAYTIFADVTGRMIDWLESEQRQLRDKLARQAPAEPKVHKRADSTLEGHGSAFEKTGLTS